MREIDWDSYDIVTRAAHGLFREFTVGKEDPSQWRAVLDLDDVCLLPDESQVPIQADLGFVCGRQVGAVYRLARVVVPVDLRVAIQKLERIVLPSVWTGVIVPIRKGPSWQWKRTVRNLNRDYTRVAQLGERDLVVDDHETSVL